MYNSRMDTKQIVAQIDAEIQKLQQAKAALLGAPAKRGPGRPPASSAKPKKRKLSADARARISEAVKRRWAKARSDSK